MYCRKCGKEIPNDTKFCPECGTPVNASSTSVSPQVPQPMYYAAPVKVKKPFYKRWYFWVVAVFVFFWLIGTIGGSGSKSDDSRASRTAQTANPSGTARPAATAKASPLDDDIIDVDISSCHVEYWYHEIVENIGGDTCIAVYYNFTNNSNDSKAFSYTVGDKAFQDGIELESSLWHVSDESHDSSAEIRPGITITVCEAYVLRNPESDVELEVEEWINFKDGPADRMVVSIK